MAEQTGIEERLETVAAGLAELREVLTDFVPIPGWTLADELYGRLQMLESVARDDPYE